MADFRDVAAEKDLKTGKVATAEVAGFRIGLALIEGTAYAFQSLCPHDKASLQDGRIAGCEILCPRHFARFDLRTGKVSAGWRVDDLKLYPTRLQDGRVQVDADALRRNPPEGPRKVWDFS